MRKEAGKGQRSSKGHRSSGNFPFPRCMLLVIRLHVAGFQKIRELKIKLW